MEMIERVARAIDTIYFDPGRNTYEMAEHAAKAAFETAKELTEAMTTAGVNFALSVSLGADYTWQQYMADLHRVMITAALQEGKETGE